MVFKSNKREAMFEVKGHHTLQYMHSGRRSCSEELSFVRFHETDWLLSQEAPESSICELKWKPDNIVVSSVYTHSCLYRHTFWAPATTLVVLCFLAIWLATE